MSENEIPGFRNYDKWMEGYDVLHNWLQDGLERIRNNKSQHMSKKERNENIKNVAFSLVSGAIDLQFIGKRDFHIDNQDMEILIRCKKEYPGMKKEEVTFSLMKDVLLVLEQEKHQFERIATSYEGN